MVMLSYKHIEQIAKETVQNFLDDPWIPFQPIDMKRMATDFLGLSLRYRNLSEYGTILGLTTFVDIAVEVWDRHDPEFVLFPKGTIILDSNLQDRRQIGRHNFTLSHEVSHQLLAKLYPEVERVYSFSKVKTCLDRRTNADWQEWQADNLASALLMPEALIRRATNIYFHSPYVEFICCRRNEPLYWDLRSMSTFFGVSVKALTIRMQRLGLLGRVQFDQHNSACLDIHAEDDDL